MNSQEPPYARWLSRLIHPFPNFDFFFIKRTREQAAQSLQLRRGGKVLDLGCGGGGSFPYLLEAVGPSGEVLGVDISSQSCINARRRALSNRWANVEVIEASVETVGLAGLYDGALMFAAPDVYLSESALANILPHLREGARIAIFGAKLSSGPLGTLLNPFFRFMCRKLSPDTPLPDGMPWALLASRVEDLHVQELFFGAMFQASGTHRSRRPGP